MVSDVVVEGCEVVMSVEQEVQVVAFAVVSGYCGVWEQVCDEKKQSPSWAGVDTQIEELGLHADPCGRGLGWSMAAGFALHTAGFDASADEVDSAFLVATQAIRLAVLGRGVGYV